MVPLAKWIFSKIGTFFMIAYIEVPPIVEQLDNSSKETGNEINTSLSSFGTRMKLESGTDLLRHAGSGWIYIQKGIFKYFYRNRLVRLYSTGDIIAITALQQDSECRCVNEFGAEIHSFSNEEMVRYTASHPEDSRRLFDYLAMQSTLMHILCALYTTDDVRPDINIKQYEPDEVIIAEGDPAHEIYQMIQGDARVTVKGVKVGEVKSGEVFGEISFLTESTRSATVTADVTCAVQVMGKNDFTAMLKLKPSVNLAISRTLSQRLVETNRKISEQQKTDGENGAS